MSSLTCSCWSLNSPKASIIRPISNRKVATLQYLAIFILQVTSALQCLEFSVTYTHRHNLESGKTFLCFIIVHVTLHKLISFVPMNEIIFTLPSHETLVSQILFNKDSSAPTAHLGQFVSLLHIWSIMPPLSTSQEKNWIILGTATFVTFSQYICVTFFLHHQVAIKQCIFFLAALEEFMQWVLNVAHHQRGVLFAVKHCKPIKTANQPLKKGGNGYVAMLTFSMSFTLSNWKVSIPQSAVVFPN